MNITGFGYDDDLFDFGSLPPLQTAVIPQVVAEPRNEDKIIAIVNEIKQQTDTFTSALPKDPFEEQRRSFTARVSNLLLSQESDFWKANKQALVEVIIAFVKFDPFKERDLGNAPLTEQVLFFQKYVTHTHDLIMKALPLLEESIKTTQLFTEILRTDWKAPGVQQKSVNKARALCEKLILSMLDPASLPALGNQVVKAILAEMADVKQIKQNPNKFIKLFSTYLEASPEQERNLYNSNVEAFTPASRTKFAQLLVTKYETLKKEMDELAKIKQLFDILKFLLDFAEQLLQEQQLQAKQKEFVTKLAQIDPALLQNLSDVLKPNSGANLLQTELKSFIKSTSHGVRPVNPDNLK